MNTVIYFLLGLGYVCLLIWGIRLSKYEGLWRLSNVLLLVIIGLIYDNVVIASGKFIGEGDFLQSLSYPRYLFHALFTPTLILFAWNVCYKVDLYWAHKTLWKLLAFILTGALIVYELITSIFGLELKSNWESGILTYEAVGPQGGPIMVITITVALLLVGFILLRDFHFSWLLYGTIVMCAGGILGIWLKGFPLMNVLEFVLILSLLMTKQFQVRNQKSSAQ